VTNALRRSKIENAIKRARLGGYTVEPGAPYALGRKDGKWVIKRWCKKRIHPLAALVYAAQAKPGPHFGVPSTVATLLDCDIPWVIEFQTGYDTGTAAGISEAYDLGVAVREKTCG